MEYSDINSNSINPNSKNIDLNLEKNLKMESSKNDSKLENISYDSKNINIMRDNVNFDELANSSKE